MSRAEVGNKALASTVGVSASVPTRWRGGTATPNLGHLVAIAGTVGCNLLWLLTGEGEQRLPVTAATDAADCLREIGGRLSELARQVEDSAESLS